MKGHVFVTIDSRDREGAREHPGEYTVRLLEDLRDVCAVKVRSTDIPPMWNVPVGRSSLWVAAGGGAFAEAVVEPGQHTAATAAAALKQALEAATPLVWNVSIGATGRFVFSATGAFALRGGDESHQDGYGPRSLGRVLGLSPGAAASVGNTLTARYSHQLDRSDTMYLHIEDYDGVQGARSGIHNCLEVINANGVEHEISSEKHFHPPLSRVNRLRVKVADYYGVPIDFDNRDHRIDLMFKTGGAESREGRGFAPSGGPFRGHPSSNDTP